MRKLALVTLAFALGCAKSADAKGQNPRVELHTNHGKIVLELDAQKAPISTKNMLDYVAAGFYDGTTFHRVIPGFMIQGGGFTQQMQKKPVKAMIKNEANNGLKNGRGTVAMARTSIPDSATSQFFINLVGNTSLDHRSTNPAEFGYCVFGRVVSGMDVVDKIAAVRTCPRGGPCPPGVGPGMRDVPLEPVVIKKARKL